VILAALDLALVIVVVRCAVRWRSVSESRASPARIGAILIGPTLLGGRCADARAVGALLQCGG